MLRAIDDRINWAAVAGALCLWDIYAKYSGSRSASRWFRAHPAATVLFLLALTNHLTRRDVP